VSQTPPYPLDANVFIEAAKRYYAFDIVPAFWQKIEELAGQGRVCSVDRVRDELMRGKDQLARWAKNDVAGVFLPTSASEVIAQYRAVMAWVNPLAQFSAAAKAAFAQGADGWLVAYAKEKRCVVVTDERLNPMIKRRVPNPNVCQAFGIRYVDTFGMLRELGIRFS
jgi:hypothetical protein